MKTEMASATAEFFDELASRSYEPLLGTETGTLRWDVTDGDGSEHWYVDVDKGNVSVSRKNAKAGTFLQMSREVSDGIVTGRSNAMAAVIRGVVATDGDLGLAMAFQRLFPGPPKGSNRSKS